MKILLISLWLTLGSDAASTTYGINKGLVREVLIPSQNVYVIDGVLTTEASGITAGLLKLNHNHPLIAKITGVSLIAVRGYVVYHNVEQLRMK